MLPDPLLAGIVGGCHKPELAFELPSQIRKVGNPSANVFFDPKTVGHAEGERGRHRELHEPRRALRGNRVGTPSRFDVNYGLHELQGEAERPSVVLGPTHLGIESRNRWHRRTGWLNAPGGTT